VERNSAACTAAEGHEGGQHSLIRRDREPSQQLKGSAAAGGDQKKSVVESVVLRSCARDTRTKRPRRKTAMRKRRSEQKSAPGAEKNEVRAAGRQCHPELNNGLIGFSMGGLPSELEEGRSLGGGHQLKRQQGIGEARLRLLVNRRLGPREGRQPRPRGDKQGSAKKDE